MACLCNWHGADPEIGRTVIKRKEETFNGFIRRNYTLRRLEKSPAQKIRDLYSKIQPGSDQTVEF